MAHKVLLCRSSRALYGPERHILQLSHGMPQHEIVPELLVLHREFATSSAFHPLTRQARAAGIAVHQLSDRGRFHPSVILGIVRRLRAGDISLVHTHGYKTNLLVGTAAALAGVPRIATVHLHTQATRALRVYRYLDLVMLHAFPRVIAVSDAIRRELLAAGLTPDRVVTIRNSIDVDQIEAAVVADRAAWLSRWKLDPHAPVVTTIGRLTPQKGQDIFLQAVRRVLDECPTTQFAILGDGPMRETLEQQASQLGIRAQAHFLDYQAEIATWIAASDVVVLASRDEGLPYTLLEALALARPVVATHVGGIPEVVKDGQRGMLVPPEAPRPLARAILQLLQHPDRAQSLGQAGRSHVRANFSVATMIEKTVQVYRSVLERSVHEHLDARSA